MLYVAVQNKMYTLETDFLFYCHTVQTSDLPDEILGICSIMSEYFYGRLTGDGFLANTGVLKLLCSVDRASLYNLVNKDNLSSPIGLYLQEKQGFSLYQHVPNHRDLHSLLLE